MKMSQTTTIQTLQILTTTSIATSIPNSNSTISMSILTTLDTSSTSTTKLATKSTFSLAPYK